ncbi:MAG: type IX secretion system outer membrane channel protein PorV [Chitinophagaceae bacterium]
MRPKLKTAALLCAVTLSTQAFSQADPINVVTSATPFLRISPDARSGGMGDMGVATAPDANSSFWNLAKTPFAKSKSGVSLTYTPWLKDLGVNDVFLASLAGYYQLDDQSAVSASMRYFNLGSIQFTDFTGNNISTGKPTELSFDLGYSRKVSDKVAVGVALRYINSNLTRGYAASNGVTYKAGSAIAGDLSLFYDNTTETGSGVRAGLALTNLGSKISYTNDAQQKDYIPANLGVGFSYTTAFDESNKLMFGIEANKLMVPTPPLATGDSATDANSLSNYRSKGIVSSWFSSFGDAGSFKSELAEYQVGLGMEYSYNDQFFVRGGYFYEDKTKGNRKFFTAGVGIVYNVFGLNFSYLIPSGNGVNRNPLSNTLRFSLVFNFNDAK